ncbi:tyrosine-type recombinase/integrase [Spirillospora sp. NPDC050679]
MPAAPIDPEDPNEESQEEQAPAKGRSQDGKRRSRGDGGLYWSEKRQRWIAEVTIGYTPAGKRIVRRRSGRTKTKARDRLRELVRDLEDGVTPSAPNYTVTAAVQDWLKYGLAGRAPSTREKLGQLAGKHVIPELGARKLRDLTADEVDRWLALKAQQVATSTLRELRSILRRAITRAQARDKVKRNVALLCELPEGRPGRPSKALTFAQAVAVLEAAETAKVWLRAYIVVSLLTGARTEEVRALTWPHVVAYDEKRKVWASVADLGWEHEQFGIYVWRSERVGGDTKTRKSRRTLKLPKRCIETLRAQWDRQAVQWAAAGDDWQDTGLVFATRTGTALAAGNVRREFRRVIGRAGLVGAEWTPQEMRHSFVSILSDNGVTLEQISRLVGHDGTGVTEKVYRQQIRPVMEEAATAMDDIFPDADHGA